MATRMVPRAIDLVKFLHRVMISGLVCCLSFSGCQAQRSVPQFTLESAAGKPMPFADYAVEGFGKRFDPECLQAYGVFTFRLNAGGVIDSVQAAGSLPAEMSNFIRDRIRTSGPYWRRPATAGYAKPLVLFVFADYYSDRTCNELEGAGTFAGLSFHLIHLFANPGQIIETPNGLLLFPAQIGGSRG